VKLTSMGHELCPACQTRRQPVVEGAIVQALTVIQPAIERLVTAHLRSVPDHVEYEHVRALVEEQVFLACWRVSGVNPTVEPG
jgi:hypothetical protein